MSLVSWNDVGKTVMNINEYMGVLAGSMCIHGTRGSCGLNKVNKNKISNWHGYFELPPSTVFGRHVKVWGKLLVRGF